MNRQTICISAQPANHHRTSRVAETGRSAARSSFRRHRIGPLDRSTAGAVSAIFGAEWLVRSIATELPKPLSDLFAKYLPTGAAARISRPGPIPSSSGPWGGLGVMAGSTTAVLAAAFAAFRKRDV
jgi:hypothetical protein